MTRLISRVAAAAMAAGIVVAGGANGSAQSGPARQQRTRQGAFVPVTDEMLWKPNPSDWLTWRRTLDSQGFSPLDQVDRTNVEPPQDGVDARHGHRQHGNDAARLQRRDVRARAPRDWIQAFDAKSGDLMWEYRRKLPEGVRGGTNRNMAIWGTTLIDGSSDNQMYAIDAQHGQTGVGNAGDRRERSAHRASSGPIIANGKVITGRQCQPRRRQRRLHHHGARRQDRQGAVAHAHDPAAGRVRLRDVGRRADGRALARGHVDGAELRPRDEPDLRRHVGHDPRAEVHDGPGRQRQDVPVSTTPRWRSMRTTARSRGTTSTWSITGISTIRSNACSWTRPSRPTRRKCRGSTRSVKPGERREGDHRHSRARPAVVYTLDRRTGEFLWARPTVQQNVIKNIDGATGAVTVNPDALFTKLGEEKMICPSAGAGGKNWPAGALQPAHERDVLPAAERVHDGEDHDRQARPVSSCTA